MVSKDGMVKLKGNVYSIKNKSCFCSWFSTAAVNYNRKKVDMTLEEVILGKLHQETINLTSH